MKKILKYVYDTVYEKYVNIPFDKHSWTRVCGQCTVHALAYKLACMEYEIRNVFQEDWGNKKRNMFLTQGVS